MQFRSARSTCALLASLAALAGCTMSSGNAASLSDSTPTPGRTTVTVLQLNLCNSGLAECYTGGRAVTMAASLIRAERPTIVTLNEICRQNVATLRHAMSAAYHRPVASEFEAAQDRRSDGPFHCTNGQQFGNGVLALLPAATARQRSYRGVYPTQDLGDPEERVWACVNVAGSYSACVTHAASTSTSIALAQCRYFLHSVVPMIRRRTGQDPLVLGADLNLPAGRTPSPQSCLPPGFRRTDDRGRQDVVATPGSVVRPRAIIDMRGTTDHPGLLVTVTLPA